MKLYSKDNNYSLYEGSMLDMLEAIEPNSIDAIITDPPYELNFMGKGWDNAGVSFQKETWEKCLKALKPGGYLLAFGGSRTYHRIACAIEDAGFDIRDCVMWLYGSGFPKSMNISKGIEARQKYGKANTVAKRQIEQDGNGKEYTVVQTNNGAMGEKKEFTRKEYTPTDETAKEWEGWGTCLKPAYEPIIVARKPFKGSLVDNVLENGVGGLNIDECRVGTGTGKEKPEYRPNNKNTVYGKGMGGGSWENTNGRFPANVIHDGSEEVCAGMPYTKGGDSKELGNYGFCFDQGERSDKPMAHGYSDQGSASRYFYSAKASKRDRDEGVELHNNHPTVKPTSLMQYLVRLVAPKGATILDPFMGSGSTGKAVMYENKDRGVDYKFVGIELTEEYLPIAEARIRYAIEDNE